MVFLTTKMGKDFDKTIGIYVISQQGRPHVYKIGMSGGAASKGAGGNQKMVGNRLLNLRTGMIDVDVHLIIQTRDTQLDMVGSHAQDLETILHDTIGAIDNVTRVKFKDGGNSEWFKVIGMSTPVFINEVIAASRQVKHPNPNTAKKRIMLPLAPINTFRFRGGAYTTKADYNTDITGNLSGVKASNVEEHLQTIHQKQGVWYTTRSGRRSLTAGNVHMSTLASNKGKAAKKLVSLK